ncbi:MAG: ABC transporter ATP-binding protein [Desulfitobacteriaceae bacterium]|nr:ABC transporter ATP-binding protein [Desulfitobacteriaceae bacterium]MDD4346757.1 ABC transporter ATP-binding protein [Desulfitobacteriaceae bacterium]MDD4402010.1 ABC transporter ATP-binding protein [Desulfitobacteriaceae bacterium]
MITVKGLHKKFKDSQALKGVDMHVQKGEIYGFIGHNGAGKSMAMNILAGLSHPTQGECIVNGRNIAEIKYPGDLHIGYLPEAPRFYPWMTAYEMLEYLGGDIKRSRITEMLEWVGLASATDRRVGGFSRGMKQMGKTVLFSTHILSDVERVCDTVGMIAEGGMVMEKPLVELQRDNIRSVFDIALAESCSPDVIAKLRELDGVMEVTSKGNTFTVTAADEIQALLVFGFALAFSLASLDSRLSICRSAFLL